MNKRAACAALAGARGQNGLRTETPTGIFTLTLINTWMGAADGVSAEVRLYDRLFTDPQPDAGGKNFLDALNPDSLKVVTAFVEPSLAAAQPDQKFQFERHGYFVADRADHGVGGKVVFNRVTGLKDSWAK